MISYGLPGTIQFCGQFFIHLPQPMQFREITYPLKVENVPEHEQRKWIDIIFEEQPYLSNVYPGSTREIGIVFCIRNAEIEYFNLGVSPIFRERYAIGNAGITEKGYVRYIFNLCRKPYGAGLFR